MPGTGTKGGILSDQIKMFIGAAPTTYDLASIKAVFTGTSDTQLAQLQSIPSLGGSTNKIDVTCLDDTAHRYINGLKDYGDSIDFTFLYDNTPSTGNYAIANSATYKDKDAAYKIAFKDGEAFYFVGRGVPSFDEVGVDAALTFTDSIALQSEIFYDPLS